MVARACGGDDVERWFGGKNSFSNSLNNDI